MTEPMKTYHEIKKNLSNKNFSEIGFKSVVELEEKAAQIYAAQQVAAEREKIKEVVEELIPMAEQYKKGIVGLSDRRAYRVGLIIERAKELIDSL